MGHLKRNHAVPELPSDSITHTTNWNGLMCLPEKLEFSALSSELSLPLIVPPVNPITPVVNPRTTPIEVPHIVLLSLLPLLIFVVVVID